MCLPFDLDEFDFIFSDIQATTKREKNINCIKVYTGRHKTRRMDKNMIKNLFLLI